MPESSPKTVFVQNLIRQRKHKGLTQRELAKLIGMPLSTYAHLESGRIPYTIIHYINKITEILEVSHQELFTCKTQYKQNDLIEQLNTIIEQIKKIRDQLS